MEDLIFLGIWLVSSVLTLAGMWKVFEKAGQPGWAAVIPIYNIYTLLKVGKNPWWYLLLFFIPVVNLLVIIKLMYDVAVQFGKGIIYGLGLSIFGFVFFPLLGYGKAQYQG